MERKLLAPVRSDNVRFCAPRADVLNAGSGRPHLTLVDFGRPGDRVFVHHHAPCFACAACRRGEYVQCATWRATNITPGGMAEYFLVSTANQRDTLMLPAEVCLDPGAQRFA